MTLRIDRSMVSEHEALTLDSKLDAAAARRERNAKTASCINETRNQTHGLATHGCRCLRCDLVHRLGSVIARQTDEWKGFTPTRSKP